MPNERQQEFDFNWKRKCALVRMSRMEPVVLPDGKPVSAAAMKAVLTVIHSHAGEDGECWISSATLAIEVSRSERTVRRALAGLKHYGLIIERDVQHGPVRLKHRRICFPNLVDHEVIKKSETEPKRPATNADRPATNARRPATNDTTPGNRLPTKKREDYQEESSKRKTASPDGLLKSDQGETIEALIDPESLVRFYEQAIEAGQLKDCDASRLLLFGFAIRCHRKRSELKNAVGFFFFGLSQGRDWLSLQVDDETDRKRAVKLLKQLRGDSEARSSDLLNEPRSQAEKLRSFEDERDRQLAALNAEFGEVGL